MKNCPHLSQNKYRHLKKNICTLYCVSCQTVKEYGKCAQSYNSNEETKEKET